MTGHEAQVTADAGDLYLMCDCGWERVYDLGHISPPLRLLRDEFKAHKAHVRRLHLEATVE
jgi:hypothetical protein